MSFGWANLTSLASNLAEKGASILAELDERIEGDEIEDADTDASKAKENGDKHTDDIDAEISSWPATHSAQHDDNDPESLQEQLYILGSKKRDPVNRTRDIQALSAQLEEVKAMREDLKTDLNNHMQKLNDEMTGAIASLNNKDAGKSTEAVSAGAVTSDAALLARAQRAEERLGSAEAALSKMREIMITTRDEVAAARKSQEQMSALQADIRAITKEKEHAELALRNITQMQSAEREELMQQVQDLQSKVASERQYAMTKADEVKALKLQAGEHLAALEILQQSTATVSKANTGITGEAEQIAQMTAQLDEMHIKFALQEEVLAGTREQLDAYIKSSAEAAHGQEQAQSMLIQQQELNTASQQLQQRIQAELDKSVMIVNELRVQLSSAESNQQASQQQLSTFQLHEKSLEQQISNLRLSAEAAQERAQLAETMAAAEKAAAEKQVAHITAISQQELQNLQTQVNFLKAQNDDWEEAATEVREQHALQAQQTLQEMNARVAEAVEQARVAAEAAQNQYRKDISARENEIASLEQRVRDYFSSQGNASQTFTEELQAKEALLSNAHAETAQERHRAEIAEGSLAEKDRAHTQELAVRAAALRALTEEHQAELHHRDTALSTMQANLLQVKAETERNEKNAMTEMQQLKETLSACQKQLDHVQHQSSVQKEQHAATLAEQQAAVVSAHAAQQQTLQQLQQQHQAHEEVNQQLHQIQEQYGALQDKLNDLTRTGDATVQKLEHQLAQYAEHIKDLEAKNAPLLADIACKEERLRQLEADLSGGNDQASSLQAALTELRIAQEAERQQTLQDKQALQTQLRRTTEDAHLELHAVQAQAAERESDLRSKLTLAESYQKELTEELRIAGINHTTALNAAEQKYAHLLDVSQQNAAEQSATQASRAAASQQIMELEQRLVHQEQEYAARIEAMEVDAQDRIVDNAALREQIRITETELTETKNRLKTEGAELARLAQLQVHSQEEHSVALARAQDEIRLLKEQLLESHRRIEAAAALQLKLQEQSGVLAETEIQLQKALTAASVATELRIRAEDAEEQLARLQQKKGKDLDALKAQNALVAALKTQLAEAQEARTEAEENLNAAQQQLAAAISPAVVIEMEKRLQEEQENCRKIKLMHEALQSQVEHSAATHGGYAQGNEIAIAQARSELAQAKEQLTSLLDQSVHSANREIEAERTIASLRAELVSERQGAEAAATQNRQYLQRLEAERARLENELHDFNTGPARTPLHVSGSRQRVAGSAGSAAAGNASPYSGGASDVEAGLLGNPDDIDEHRKQGDPIPAVINTLWRTAAKYPVLLHYIGETPPRLGPLGRFLAGYIVVIHLLLLLGII